MNKTIAKIMISFIASAVFISLVLLAINFFAFALTASDTRRSPGKTLRAVSENLKKTDDGFVLEDSGALGEKNWAVLLDESGSVIWEKNRPSDVPEQFTINQVASMTRWFFNDYPVYVDTRDDGLLILGFPKNTVGKYHMEYSMDWFATLPTRILAVILFNTVLAILLAMLFGFKLYRRLKGLVFGIRCLREERPVRMKEKGIFKELIRGVNDTSSAIERKNQILKQRDDARSNWIAGISHDIRTPLSIIMGYSEELAMAVQDKNQRKKAEIITAQSVKMKKLVEDLNLISSLEYDMQPAKKKKIKICGLLRETVSEFLNSSEDGLNIALDLKYEKAAVSGDENLLKRAVFNIINNSVIHNGATCRIQIVQDVIKEEDMCRIFICDNGTGVDETVLENIETIPKSAHGLGLPMAYRIIKVHGGAFRAWNQEGFCLEIKLPLTHN